VLYHTGRIGYIVEIVLFCFTESSFHDAQFQNDFELMNRRDQWYAAGRQSGELESLCFTRVLLN